MTASRTMAVAAALDLMRAPAALSDLQASPLPEGMGRLIRLVSGDAATLALSISESRASADQLREAAAFFLQQVCFTPGIDNYRVLGVTRGAGDDQIREHYRLLVRWLHPDRNSDEWQNVFMDRVNAAWKDLRSAEARAHYDEQSGSDELAVDAEPVNNMPMVSPRWMANEPTAWSAARLMHSLPALILVGLGVLCLLGLWLLYLEKRQEARYVVVAAQRASSDPVRDLIDANSHSIKTRGTAPVAQSVAIDDAARTPSIPAPSDTLGQTEPNPSARERSAVAAPVARADASPPVPRRAHAIAAVNKSELASAPVLADPREPKPMQRAAAPSMPELQGAPSTDAAPMSEPDPSPGDVVDVDGSVVIPDRPGAAAASPVVSVESRVDERLINDLLQEYRSAYDDGDLIRLMALFTTVARNRSDDSGRLADRYRALFESSGRRRLAIEDVTWWLDGDVIAVVAHYNTSITPTGASRSKRSGGDIRFDLRREAGSMRIARVRHEAH